MRLSQRALLVVAAALAAGCAVPNPTKMERLDDMPASKLPEIDAVPEILASR